MANYSCNSCDDLRTTSPSFVVNGITDTECTSLQNDTGLNPSSGHDDCTDLNNINDCLVGNMAEEVEAYDVCDWKTYMKKFVPNVWTTFKAIICAICGLWAKVNKHDCILTHITGQQSFAVSEENIKWYNGVTKNTDGNPDLATPKITGNAYCGYLTGSIVIPGSFESDFPSSSITTHGILLYEYRIKLADFDLKRVWPCNLQEAVNGSGIHAHAHIFYETDTSDPTDYPYASGDTGYASYAVPQGWVYIQVRISSYDDIPSSGKVTLCGVIPVLMNAAEFEC